MNILDVKDSDLGITSEDKLGQIFRRQLELMQKYHGIELKNGLLITAEVPVNLHDALGQYRLKDFAWRITEELGEALEALLVHPDIPEHYEEEIIDALHFLVEFTILAGATPIILKKKENNLRGLYRLFRSEKYPTREYSVLAEYTGYCIKCLATTCNTLKNKPWKQTQIMTDETYFRGNLLKTWMAFIQLCHKSGIDEEKLINTYFKKSEVNRFRQRSNY